MRRNKQIPLAWPVNYAEFGGISAVGIYLYYFVDPVSTVLHGVGINRFRQTPESGGNLPMAGGSMMKQDKHVTCWPSRREATPSLQLQGAHPYHVNYPNVPLCPKYHFEDQTSAVLQVAFRIGALELNQVAFPRNKNTFRNVYSDQVCVFVNELHHYFKHISTKFYMWKIKGSFLACQSSIKK